MTERHQNNILMNKDAIIKKRFISYIFIIATITAIGVGFNPQPMQAAELATSANDENIEVLASGPIHEAFAEAVTLDPEPGLLVSKKPPRLIEEIPPNEKPEGDVQWIPGYWAWDDEREDFIWISGIWRVPPPDRQWIPGYWNSTGYGYQWISGYWASDGESETAYLPEPPESVEVGPSSNAPSPDHTWIPGCWVWHNGRYAWRAGYWARVYPNWVWVPEHYVWSPRGYIYVSGYWDFTVSHRGVLFAPIFFPAYVHVGWIHPFTPGFIVHLTIFNDALFLRPRYHHYYFGDYYAHHHYRRGIYPWFSLHARRVVYDPIYAHQRWYHRNDRQWESRLESDFQKRRSNKALRPPRRYDHRSKSKTVTLTTEQRPPSFVAPLNRAGRITTDGYHFKPLGETERVNFLQREKDISRYRKERQDQETIKRQPPERERAKTTRPDIRKMPKSPIRSKPDRTLNVQPTLPKRQRAPRPNPNIEPLERKHRTEPNWPITEEQKDHDGNYNTRPRQPSETAPRQGNGRPENNGYRQRYQDRRPNSGGSRGGWNNR